MLHVWDRTEVYQGPYVCNAPELIVGFNKGFRVSWDCAQGRVSDPVFEDNTKAWSGDHCLEPAIVPGALFTSFKHSTDRPNLTDLAPTVLELLGVPVPNYVDGKCLEKIEFEQPSKQEVVPEAVPDEETAAARAEGTA